MPTKRDSEFDLDNNNNDTVSEPVTVEQPVQSATESTYSRKPSRRVQVPLSQDGRIDLELLNSSQRPKIEKAIELELAARIQSQKDSLPERKLVQFNRDYVPTVVDAFAMLVRTSLNLTNRFHHMPKDFVAYLKYNKEQKELLKEPTAKLIEKYCPAAFLNNQELANFVLAFTTVTKEMFESATVNYLLAKGMTPEQIEVLRNQAMQQVNGVAQPTEVAQ